MNPKNTAMAGALVMMLAIVLGAFGAHALKSVLSVDARAVYQTASHYQFVHGLALLLLAVFWQMTGSTPSSSRQFRRSAWFFAFGVLSFCGSLYALSVTQFKPLGMVTPIGGVAFILAWWFMFSGLRSASWKSEHERE